MISQGYTPYCAALSLHHSVRVCLCVCECVQYVIVCLENASCYRKNGYKQTDIQYMNICTIWTERTRFGLKCHLD